MKVYISISTDMLKYTHTNAHTHTENKHSQVIGVIKDADGGQELDGIHHHVWHPGGHGSHQERDPLGGHQHGFQTILPEREREGQRESERAQEREGDKEKERTRGFIFILLFLDDCMVVLRLYADVCVSIDHHTFFLFPFHCYCIC